MARRSQRSSVTRSRKPTRTIGIGRPRPRPSGNQVNVGFTRPTTRPVGRPDRPNAIGVGRPTPIGTVHGGRRGTRFGRPAVEPEGSFGRFGGRFGRGRTITSVSKPTRSGGRLTVIKGTGGKQPDRSIIIKTGGKQFDRSRLAGTGGKQSDRDRVGRSKFATGGKQFDRSRTRDTGVDTSGRSKAFSKLAFVSFSGVQGGKKLVSNTQRLKNAQALNRAKLRSAKTKTKRKQARRGGVPIGLGRRGVLNQRGGAVRKLKKKLGIKRVALKIPKTRSKGKARGRKVGRNLTPRTPRRIGRRPTNFGSDFSIFNVGQEFEGGSAPRVRTGRAVTGIRGTRTGTRTPIRKRVRTPRSRVGTGLLRSSEQRRQIRRGSDFDIFRV